LVCADVTVATVATVVGAVGAKGRGVKSSGGVRWHSAASSVANISCNPARMKTIL
jgi:hypothetical protein